MGYTNKDRTKIIETAISRYQMAKGDGIHREANVADALNELQNVLVMCSPFNTPGIAKLEEAIHEAQDILLGYFKASLKSYIGMYGCDNIIVRNNSILGMYEILLRNGNNTVVIEHTMRNSSELDMIALGNLARSLGCVCTN